MDPIHIIQVSLLSKFINEPFDINKTNPFILSCIFIYVSLKTIPYPLYDYIEGKFKEFFLQKNECSITIPYHIKSYVGFGCNKSIDKVLYSNRFRAINHHIKKHHLHKLFSLTEILNFENTKYLEGDSDYILVPKNKDKIKINDDENIFFEILLDKKRDSNDGKNDKSEERSNHTKKYIYKLTKTGKDSIQSLQTFLEKVEKEYLDEIVNKNEQMVFEYKKTVKDEVEDSQMTIFGETPFKTNKSFDNIFFEAKPDFIEYISRFSKNSELEKHYEESGNPFKAVILLHGDPGCGKSSLIKATIKHLKRHCILVPWTKIKTCNDFVSLFRPIKINNKVYQQDELIIVFEDFDANENEILKIRSTLKKKGIRKEMPISEMTEDLWKRNIESFDTLLSCKKNDDELTLEYILNVLDGIVELYNSVVFFTTNCIDLIDPALKRTGRIDRIMKMERATRPIIMEMIGHRFTPFYIEDSKDKIFDKSIMKEINKIPEYKFAYADISQICNDSKTISECLERIQKIRK